MTKGVLNIFTFLSYSGNGQCSAFFRNLTGCFFIVKSIPAARRKVKPLFYCKKIFTILPYSTVNRPAFLELYTKEYKKNTPDTEYVRGILDYEVINLRREVSYFCFRQLPFPSAAFPILPFLSFSEPPAVPRLSCFRQPRIPDSSGDRIYIRCGYRWRRRYRYAF